MIGQKKRQGMQQDFRIWLITVMLINFLDAIREISFPESSLNTVIKKKRKVIKKDFGK